MARKKIYRASSTSEDYTMDPEMRSILGASDRRSLDTGDDKTRITKDELSSGHVFRQKKSFDKRVIYTDRPAFERRSNNLVRESWSFHSAFPSLRTFVPLLALSVSAWIIAAFKIATIKWQVIAALSSLFGIAMIIAIVFFFIESTKPRFSHAVKDGLIHAAIFVLLLYFNWDFDASLSVFLLYVGAHWLMHAIDFHIERASNRGWKLLTYGSMLVFIELVLAANFGI